MSCQLDIEYRKRLAKSIAPQTQLRYTSFESNLNKFLAGKNTHEESHFNHRSDRCSCNNDSLGQ
jgi:hypothetical protein